MESPSSERIDECLIALRRILRATSMYDRELANATGVTPAQLRVLQLLDFKDNFTMTPKALAAQMGIAQATVTAIIDKLQASGMLTRNRSETDRRQTNLAITEVGRATVHAAPDALQQRFVRAFDRMHDWEQSQLVASLQRVASMLDANDLDASPVLTTRELHASTK
ncbi:MarR family winged helix-turn-helix transcriptional regulator [Marivita sp. S0852]|uniref:MarR family winged helix-turn-helix transcriptional regulator n=1 Tax=Marivita sp. S0852 TaxID=3373893 RepID=UPI003981955B